MCKVETENLKKCVWRTTSNTLLLSSSTEGLLNDVEGERFPGGGKAKKEVHSHYTHSLWGELGAREHGPSQSR